MKLLLAIAICMASLPALAQVYKCPGPNGTIYSDAPCPSGQKIDDAKLRGSNLGPAIPSREPAKPLDPAAAAPVQQQPTARASNCPSEQEIRNLETSLSSITMQGANRRKEREFMQAEVRRARACQKEGGNYTAEDWKRIKEAQASQNRIDSADRAGARATAESIHAPAASDRENQRMMNDKLVEAERETAEQARRDAERRAEPVNITKCDAKGCWGVDGGRYNRTPNGNFVRQDGAVCQSTGNQLRCN